MEPTPDDVALGAWRAVLRAQRRVNRALDVDLSQRVGISLRAYDVLARLARAPGGCLRMSELAASVMLSASGISRLVDHLVDRRLVERRPDSSDARVAIATLTREGRAMLRKASGIYAEGVKRHFAGQLTEDELASISATFERLAAASEPWPPAADQQRGRRTQRREGRATPS